MYAWQVLNELNITFRFYILNFNSIKLLFYVCVGVGCRCNSTYLNQRSLPLSKVYKAENSHQKNVL